MTAPYFLEYKEIDAAIKALKKVIVEKKLKITVVFAAVWKSTSASGGTSTTPSSRRRVDGVKDDATIQHERALKF